MTQEEVEGLALRGRFEDRRRDAGDEAQIAVDQLRRSSLPVRSIYLVRETILGRKQVEAEFAVAIDPGKRIAVLAPVPMAGNAKVAEVGSIRRLTAAAVLKQTYRDGWQVFVLSTQGRLNDRDVLEILGVRFPDRISAEDKSNLVSLFGVEVEIGLPGPARQELPARSSGRPYCWASAISALSRLLPGLPRGRVKAQVEVEVDLDALGTGDAEIELLEKK
jgi:hypothetical protein